MTRQESIAIIKAYMSQQPVEWVGVFGSFARNEMRDESDIDIVVQFKLSCPSKSGTKNK